METRRAALVALALVVVSGWVGTAAAPADPAAPGTVASGAGADATTTANATTTPPANATLPPGVNGSGVEDVDELVSAHRAALDNTSFAFRFGANVSVGPASQWTVMRGTVEEGLSPLVVHSASVRRIDGDSSTFVTDIWANRTGVAVQYSRENRTEVRWFDREGGNVGVYDETWSHLPRADLEAQVTQSWLLELALTVGEYDLVGTERRGGHRVAVLRATEPVAAANFTDLNATVVVDPTGRVRSLSLTAAYEGEDAPRIHYEFELTRVDNVSTSKPTWAEAATPPNASATNATTTAATTTPPNVMTTLNATTTTTRSG